MNELNPELLGKELWKQTHEEIEECEDNYDDDGNCRYSEQAFIEMFQQAKDMQEGKIPKKTWREVLAEIRAEEMIEDDEVEENADETSFSHQMV